MFATDASDRLFGATCFFPANITAGLVVFFSLLQKSEFSMVQLSLIPRGAEDHAHSFKSPHTWFLHWKSSIFAFFHIVVDPVFPVVHHLRHIFTSSDSTRWNDSTVSTRYVLIMYTEDQAAQNDGKLSDPIYFQVPVSNGFIIQPSLVSQLHWWLW